MEKAKLMDWGKSMYGGYYACVFTGGDYEWLHGDKLKDLRAELARFGLKAEPTKRFDNI